MNFLLWQSLFWLVFSGVIALALGFLVRFVLGQPHGEEPHCKKCEYNLRGGMDRNKQCPECGALLTRRRVRKGALVHARMKLMLSIAFFAVATHVWMNGKTRLDAWQALPGELHTAVLKKNAYNANRLLTEHPDLASGDTLAVYGALAQEWPVVAAVKQGDRDVLKRVLQENPPLENLGNQGMTALYLAATQQDWEVCRLLLEAGADPNWLPPTSHVGQPAEGGKRPPSVLEMALKQTIGHLGKHPARREWKQCLTALVDHGALVDPMRPDLPPLHAVMASTKSDRGFVYNAKLLVEAGVRVDPGLYEGKTLLHRWEEACGPNVNSFSDGYPWLIGQGLDPLQRDAKGRFPGQVDVPGDGSVCMASWWANHWLSSRRGRERSRAFADMLGREPSMAEWQVIDSPFGSVSTQFKKPWPMLFAAAAADNRYVVESLLAAGADPNRVDPGTGETALGAACAGYASPSNDRDRVIKLLLNQGGDPFHRNALGMSAFHWACPRPINLQVLMDHFPESEHAAVVDRVAAVGPWRMWDMVNTWRSRTPSDRLPREYLPAMGFDEPGVLHWAGTGNIAELEAAVAAEPTALVAPQNPQGNTALMVAVQAGQLETAAWLLEHGADPNGNAVIPEHWGQSLAALLREAWNFQYFKSPLAYAMYRARYQPEMADLLIRHGADPNLVLDGQGPLLQVLIRCPVHRLDEKMALLMNLGADPFVRDARGQNAFDCLAQKTQMAPTKKQRLEHLLSGELDPLVVLLNPLK